MTRVLVGMSGGVDSSVTACILKNEGYDVAGVSIKMYDGNASCSGENDRKDAKKVSDILGIDYYIYDFRDRFKEKVIDKFGQEYQEGRTPNPCIDCNKNIKFSGILAAADEYGYDKIATGHYASVEYDEDKDRYLLKKSKDPARDQSYFLYNLKQDQLARLIFPMEGYTKDQTRQIAKENNLGVHSKPDSQDICFIKEGDYETYLKDYLNMDLKPGKFVDKDGNILGDHEGYSKYTIGQRKGLGLSLEEPAYVIDIRPDTNEVVIGKNEDLYTSTMKVKDLNLIYQDQIQDGQEVSVKTRYSQHEVGAVLEPKSDYVQVHFQEPVRAVTPGQAAVFYLGDYVLGGGTIV